MRSQPGGVSGLVVIDIDVKNSATWRESRDQLNLPHTLTAQTPSGGWHAFFKHPGGTIRSKVAVLPGIDVRADGGYVVAVGSSLDIGDYKWMDDDAAIADLPPHVAALLSDSPPIAKPNGNGLAVPQGQRNQHLASFAGRLRAASADREAIEAALFSENRKCDPPLPPEEVRRIAASIAR